MQHGQNNGAWLEEIRGMSGGPITLMEVCGTHTMAIAKAGIKGLLKEKVKLLSGPGCPVCVTPAGEIDLFLELAKKPGILLCTYGDMLRVPGSEPGDTLLRRKADGARVQVVYSPMDAVELAERKPEQEIVFVGVGFETTAPGTAAAIVAAKERGLTNFSVLSLLKRVEPALRLLVEDEDLKVDGFLCPGHVATVMGAESFGFLAEEYGVPAVVAGFEPEEILQAVYDLCLMVRDQSPALKNDYPRAVSSRGNLLAQAMTDRVFEPGPSTWRGLGDLAEGGLAIREDFALWDARRKFDLKEKATAPVRGCLCGEIIKGKKEPKDCPFFGKRCVPEDPVGPCMVSGEGSCAAAYIHPETP